MLNPPSAAAAANRRQARRFDLHVALRYRHDGDARWHKGFTRNIGPAGVLFEGEDRVQPSTAVEITLALPKRIVGEETAELHCEGTVTRSESRGGDGARSVTAIKISHYRLVRP
jgi:hypothetical protein